MQPRATARHDIGQVGNLLARVSGLLAAMAKAALERFPGTYHPERHYMRGPGPKCRQAARKTRGYDRGGGLFGEKR